MSDDEDAPPFCKSKSVTAEMLYDYALNHAASVYGKEYVGSKFWEWFIPEERAIFIPGSFHMSKTTRQQMNKANWHLEFDAGRMHPDFARIVVACAKVKRKLDPDEGSEDYDFIEWLDRETQTAFLKLSALGRCYHISVRDGEALVGGIFGICLPKYLTVESMYTIQSGASKAAMLFLEQLCLTFGIEAVDGQDYSEHLASLGAVKQSSKQFDEDRYRYSPITYPVYATVPRLATAREVAAAKKKLGKTIP